MNKYPCIAREGWERLAAAFVVCLIASFSIAWWSLIGWFIFAFMLQFFRDPPRRISSKEGDIVAPASGKVIKIEQAKDPYLDREAIKISIFMNVFSVHSNLLPVAGEVKQRWYVPGKFFNAALDKASTDNERNALWIKTSLTASEANKTDTAGADVVVVQVAGLIARRILCYVKEGDRVQKGQRYGFIRFGSRVDLYLPPTCVISAQLGQWVDSGNHVLATLPNTSPNTSPNTLPNTLPNSASALNPQSL